MRIAMTGSGLMATLIVRAIVASGHELVAVIDNGRTVKGYKRWLSPLLASVFTPNAQVSAIARRRGVPIVYIDKMTPDELAPLAAAKPDLIVVGGFSIILKKPIITLPRIGCINCHSSLLPKHRGPNPFQAVILAGETETGMTFHVIDEGIDTGPLLAQYRIPVTGSDTAGTLLRRTSQLAADKIPEVLARIEREGVVGAVQSGEDASYDKKLTDDELYLDWTRPAEELDRKARACFPYSMARFRYRGRTILVSRVKAYEQDTDQPPGTITAARPFVRVATGKGTLAVMVGYTMTKPLPWLWPGLFWRPPVGDRLE
ncbi:MAG: methionyl-tRNA formyltransferase [Candidatus Hydrogenedentes bacterium]|nr:methionyl-tRNA formyltransferase [Candidatus Hydrogenedentota bacterium]